MKLGISCASTSDLERNYIIKVLNCINYMITVLSLVIMGVLIVYALINLK